MSKSTKNLSIFKLKGNLDFDMYISNLGTCQGYDLNNKIKFDGKIFVGDEKSQIPTWLNFIREGTDTQIPDIFNSSNRAVMIIDVNGGLFAVTFGYGQYLLREEHIERNFGLKTALNGVNPEKLRSIDLISIYNLGVNTRMQTAKRSSRDVFGYDMLNDLLKVVVGQPIDLKLGKVITGQDQLSISPKMSFKDLEVILPQIDLLNKNDHYKNNFDWIDNIRYVKSPSIVSVLNDALVTKFRDKKFDEIYLAPPEPIDWSAYKYCSYTKKGNEVIDMDAEEFYNSLLNPANFDLQTLKNRKVILHDVSSDVKIPKWKIFDCISFETSVAGKRYILSSGSWYQVDMNYANQVKAFVKSMEESKIMIISAKLKEKEGEYNERLVNSNVKYSLGDKRNVKCEFARTVIEPCDVFTSDKQIIHIKPGRKSSTLSHLFSQGRVSAEALLRDKVFRKGFRKNLRIEGKLSDSLIPINKIDPGDYEIVFLFIDKKDQPFEEMLPFFSLVNLMHTVIKIRMMGFSVKLKKVIRK